MTITKRPGFFRNGTVKTILTVVLTLVATGVCTYAWQGLQNYSKEESDKRFVSKELYQKDVELADEKLDNILCIAKENREDIKTLLKERGSAPTP